MSGYMRYWLSGLIAIVGVSLIIVGVSFIGSVPPDGIQPNIIEMFGAKFEGNDVGVTLVFLGIICLVLAGIETRDVRHNDLVHKAIGQANDIAAKAAADVDDLKAAAADTSKERQMLQKRAKKIRRSRQLYRDAGANLAAILDITKGMQDALDEDDDIDNPDQEGNDGN